VSASITCTPPLQTCTSAVNTPCIRWLCTWCTFPQLQWHGRAAQCHVSDVASHRWFGGPVLFPWPDARSRYSTVPRSDWSACHAAILVSWLPSNSVRTKHLQAGWHTLNGCSLPAQWLSVSEGLACCRAMSMTQGPFNLYNIAHSVHRWGYANMSVMEQVVDNYTAAGLPLEVIWSDIEYMPTRFWTMEFDQCACSCGRRGQCRAVRMIALVGMVLGRSLCCALQ
jgi:hypothetical protein